MRNMTNLTKKLLTVTIVVFFLCFLSPMAVSSAADEGSPPEIISFGGNNWIVLTVEDGRALVLSERVLEFRMFHTIGEDAAWENSSLRHHLNNDFLYNNFSSDERQSIIPVRVTNECNQWFGTAGGNDTLDYVFLLSLEEVVMFFGDSGQLVDRHHQDNIWWGIHDRYSTKRIARNLAGVDSWWWLRSPGDYDSGAALVSPGGRVHVAGYDLLRAGAWVRPALWLDLSRIQPTDARMVCDIHSQRQNIETVYLPIPIHVSGCVVYCADRGMVCDEHSQV